MRPLLILNHAPDGSERSCDEARGADKILVH